MASFGKLVLLKIIVVGDYKVGKTSLILRYIENVFQTSYKPTLGIDIFTRNFEFSPNEKVKAVIFDTAGQERLKGLTQRYFHGSHGAVLVFDVTNRKTFESIRRWHMEIKNKCGSIPIFLIGNKIDLIDKREVSREEAKGLAEELGMEYIETSALENENVEDVFESIVLEAYTRITKTMH